MQRLNIDVWFADPHTPRQPGSNENPNGLLRKLLSKGADLSQVSQEYLNRIAMLMNGHPRETLGWASPAEVMEREISSFKSRLHLILETALFDCAYNKSDRSTALPP